jgi:hypothetical protein
MAYVKSKIEKQAVEAIRTRKLVFEDEVIAYIDPGKTWFYSHKLNESDAIKEALSLNRIQIKAGLRDKWYTSENATTQIALYKLIGDEDEVERLNGSRQKLEHSGPDGGAITVKVEFSE